MDLLQIVTLILHVTHICTHRSRSKKYLSSSASGETIENLLYYKDCSKRPKPDPTTPRVVMRAPMTPPPAPPPPQQPDCPFPKMCCSLSCGNECGQTREPTFMSRHVEPMKNVQRQNIQPLQQMLQPVQSNMMPVQPQIRKRKKMKFPSGKLQMPIGGGRRAFGFTKEKIKSLISQDEDIRKILKDLVRVTMQKVDLLDMLNGDKPDDTDTDVTESSNHQEYLEFETTTPEVLDEDYGE